MKEMLDQRPVEKGWVQRLLPGLGSIKGRYLYTAGLMVLLLGFAALVGRQYVSATAESAVEKIRSRSQLSGNLQDVMRQLDGTQKRLERFVLDPQEEGRDRLERAVALLGVALMRLDDSRWQMAQRTTATLLGMLHSDYQRLKQAIEELIRIRLDVNQWFPVSVILETELMPRNTGFSVAMESLIRELESGADDVRGDDLYLMAVKLRHYWNRMTSEFRLYIANRLGVFSVDALEGMAGRAANIRTYSNSVAELLQRMQSGLDDRDGDAMFGDVVVQLRDHYEGWLVGYEKVVRGVHQEGWRRDIAQLTRKIDPLMDSLQQRMATLKLELDTESAQDITLLTRTAQRLSDVFLLATLVGALLILFGYLLFVRGLLNPVAQLTRALKAEALGQHHGSLPAADAEETRDLLQAFQWMRRQVRERQSHLDHLAHHDALTGLPNRLLFRDRLEHALRISKRGDTQVAVLFLDLDRFKEVNDSLGHLVGDLLLMEVADRLRRTLRGADTVARISGDEFAVLMESIDNRDEVTVVVEKVLESLSQAYRLDGQDVETSASVGIAMGPVDAGEVEALLRAADAAMYEAKRRGRNGFRFFSSDITERAMAFLRLEQELRQALERDAFPLRFQPILSADGAGVFACEVLLRWSTPERGEVPPERFLSVLEETGLIEPVTERLLAGVSDLQRTIRQDGLQLPAISFNLSGRLVESGHFIDNLLGHLRRGALQADQILVEVSEKVLARGQQSAEEQLQRLREQGIRIVLDDFGKGNSSLTRLRSFPFDMLKIDAAVLQEVPGDPQQEAMIKGIIKLAHCFATSVTAEGVERPEQVDFLRRNGCDFVQGYHFSPPLNADDLLDYLRRRQSGANKALERPALGSNVTPLR